MANRYQHMEVERALLKDLAPRSFRLRGHLWIIALGIIFLTGLYFYIGQLRDGLVVTGMRDYNTWGLYVSNFVFFVAISLVGSLVSAILKLSGVKWGTPITRIAEMIAVSSIFFASLVIIIDMGRPDRVMNVVFKARLQSPITWDVIVIATYLLISMLLLYMPMLPDFALLRDHMPGISPWRKKIYRFLSLNWQGTEQQQLLLNRAIQILAVLIIPVAFGIHTVTSWLFATTLRPGWDSNNFGPYFVSGAFMVGAAVVIIAMYLIRQNHAANRKYITDDLFEKMGRLLVLLSMVYLYFNINEYFVPFYKMKAAEAIHLEALFFGKYAPLFWSVQVGGMLLPIGVLLFRNGRRPVPLLIMSVFVVVGAWLKRFLIVIPTLDHPFIPNHRLPEEWLHYHATFAEWSITLATIAGAMLLVTLMVRLVPSIPIWEIAEEIKHSGTSQPIDPLDNQQDELD